MESIYGKCPFATTQRVLQGKWAVVALYQLSTRTKKFGELEKMMPEVTRTVLTRQLRQPEEDKLIERKIYAEVPPDGQPIVVFRGTGEAEWPELKKTNKRMICG